MPKILPKTELEKSNHKDTKMSDESIKKSVLDFSKSNIPQYKKFFKVTDNDNEVFTVTIERRKRSVATESMIFEARSNTISAFPSGSPCGCCSGSGRSS